MHFDIYIYIERERERERERDKVESSSVVEGELAFEVKIELFFNFLITMYLLAHKNAQNSSIKDKLWGSLYVTIEGVPKIFFQ